MEGERDKKKKRKKRKEGKKYRTEHRIRDTGKKGKV